MTQLVTDQQKMSPTFLFTNVILTNVGYDLSENDIASYCLPGNDKAGYCLSDNDKAGYWLSGNDKAGYWYWMSSSTIIINQIITNLMLPRLGIADQKMTYLDTDYQIKCDLLHNSLPPFDHEISEQTLITKLVT